MSLAGLAMLMTVVMGGFQIFNPKSDIKDAKEDVLKQIGALDHAIADLKTDLRWNYASKDLLAGKIDAEDKEKASYRLGMERLIARIENKTNSLDADIHATYSPKDAIAAIQSRIVELERAARDNASSKAGAR